MQLVQNPGEALAELPVGELTEADLNAGPPVQVVTVPVDVDPATSAAPAIGEGQDSTLPKRVVRPDKIRSQTTGRIGSGEPQRQAGCGGEQKTACRKPEN